MRTFGWTPSEGELQELIGVIDQDENGCISFDEFVWLMSQDLHDEDIEVSVSTIIDLFQWHSARVYIKEPKFGFYFLTFKPNQSHYCRDTAVINPPNYISKQ